MRDDGDKETRVTETFWAQHGAMSDPGALADWIDEIPADPAAIREAAGRLVFHYRAHGDVGEHGFTPDRMAEINLRYAQDMFARLRAMNPNGPAGPREPTERLLGCCRDFTLLFVALARHKGLPSRSRVGFASYFVPGWFLDHVVPEVWVDGRWVLMEPEIGPGYVDPNDGAVLNPCDLPRDRFLVGPQAWLDARAGTRNPETFVVAPDLMVPDLRSWPYLLHNLVLDVAALNKQEMVLWDVWGLADGRVPDAGDAARIDEIARQILAGADDPATVAALAREPGFRVPEVIRSIDPVVHVWSDVELRR